MQRLDGLGLVGAVRGIEARAPLDAYDDSEWFSLFLDTCLDPEDRIASALVRAGGASLVLPLRIAPAKMKGLSFRRLRGLTNFYSCRFDLPCNEMPSAMLVEAWAREVRQGRPRPAEIVVECLDPRSAGFEALREGLARAGYWVAPYFMFLTRLSALSPWRAAGGFEAWWNARPSALRNTVERKAKQAAKQGYTIRVSQSGDDPEPFVAAYESVHAASWKPPEPYPNFMPELIRRGLPQNRVTAALLEKDGAAVAAQVWFGTGARRTIFKLSYREDAKALSAGSILTRDMMRRAFDDPAIETVDFGWGDDDYKKDWLPDAVERWGLTAYDPATPAGFALGLRNVVAKRLLGKLPQPPTV